MNGGVKILPPHPLVISAALVQVAGENRPLRTCCSFLLPQISPYKEHNIPRWMNKEKKLGAILHFSRRPFPLLLSSQAQPILRRATKPTSRQCQNSYRENIELLQFCTGEFFCTADT